MSDTIIIDRWPIVDCCSLAQTLHEAGRVVDLDGGDSIGTIRSTSSPPRRDISQATLIRLDRCDGKSTYALELD